MQEKVAGVSLKDISPIPIVTDANTLHYILGKIQNLESVNGSVCNEEMQTRRRKIIEKSKNLDERCRKIYDTHIFMEEIERTIYVAGKFDKGLKEKIKVILDEIRNHVLGH
jgi:hypothetical protein